MHDLTVTLSLGFNMSPFDVRRERFVDVFKLVDRVNKYGKQDKKQSNTANVVRRPAVDWF